MPTKIRLAVLGSTGSIGVQTLNVLSRNSDLFDLVLLANFANAQGIEEQQKKYSAQKIYTQSTAEDKDFLFREETYADIDLVVNGISGLDGLLPSLAVVSAGKILATANKESIVCFGEQLKAVAAKTGAIIRPIDSEHSTIWQCFEEHDNVKRILITASGGAFRDFSISEIENATAEQALAHPNWIMGAKVTIDCATMVNKGLEIIEAKRFFGIDDITPILHRESIVHSLVEMQDGTLKAGLSAPNMEIPIQYAMMYPYRKPTPAVGLDLAKIGALHFEEIDRNKYPALAIAERIAKMDAFYATVFVAADEILVKLYREAKIKYFDIAKYIDMCLDNIPYKKVDCVQDVFCIIEAAQTYLLGMMGEK